MLSSPDVKELTQQPFIFPDFVDTKKANLKIIDAGYIVEDIHITPTRSVEDLTLLRAFAKYVEGPLITDCSRSHRYQRKPFEISQTDEVQDLFKHNRISRGAMGLPGTAAALICWEDSHMNTKIIVTDDQRKKLEELERDMFEVKNRVINIKEALSPPDVPDEDQDVVSKQWKEKVDKSDMTDLEKARLKLSGEEASRASELINIMEGDNYDEASDWTKKLIGNKKDVLGQSEAWARIKKNQGLDGDIELLGGNDTVNYLFQTFIARFLLGDTYDYGYDVLTTGEKLEFVDRYTNLSIQILRQNGFTVEKRPFQPLKTV